jgi:Major Facilitator Superfamily
VATQMHIPFQRRQRSIDYIGATVITAAVCSIVLVTVWGGNTYAWASPEIIGLIVAALVLAIILLLVERRVSEPVLPLTLFSNPTVRAASLASFGIGAIVFASTIYIPLYAQGALGTSATRSGLLLIPMNFAWIAMSVLIGHRIARHGHYRRYPIRGALITILGVFLLGQAASVGGAILPIAGAGLVIGLGMGMTVQTSVTAAQNVVDRSLLGVATANIQLWRSIGGTLSVALYGAVLNYGLHTWFAAHGMGTSRVSPAELLRAPGDTTRLSPRVISDVHRAFAASLHTVLVGMLPFALVIFVGTLLIQELPLRTDVGSATAMPGGEAEPQALASVARR